MTKSKLEGILKRLEASELHDVSADELTLDEWIDFAKKLQSKAVLSDKPIGQMVARIQCLLVDSKQITDEEYVQRITQ